MTVRETPFAPLRKIMSAHQLAILFASLMTSIGGSIVLLMTARPPSSPSATTSDVVMAETEQDPIEVS